MYGENPLSKGKNVVQSDFGNNHNIVKCEITRQTRAVIITFNNKPNASSLQPLDFD